MLVLQSSNKNKSQRATSYIACDLINHTVYLEPFSKNLIGLTAKAKKRWVVAVAHLKLATDDPPTGPAKNSRTNYSPNIQGLCTNLLMFFQMEGVVTGLAATACLSLSMMTTPRHLGDHD